MRNRREDQSGSYDEHKPSVKGIQAREQLAAGGDWSVNRAHAAQEHRRVKEGIHHGKMLEVRISEHSDAKRHDQQPQRERHMKQQSLRKADSGKWRLRLRFVHDRAKLP